MTEQTIFSLASLHTVSGASMATLLVVQLIKGLPVISPITLTCLAIIIGILLFLIYIITSILSRRFNRYRFKWPSLCIHGNWWMAYD